MVLSLLWICGILNNNADFMCFYLIWWKLIFVILFFISIILSFSDAFYFIGTIVDPYNSNRLKDLGEVNQNLLIYIVFTVLVWIVVTIKHLLYKTIEESEHERSLSDTTQVDGTKMNFFFKLFYITKSVGKFYLKPFEDCFSFDFLSEFGKYICKIIGHYSSGCTQIGVETILKGNKHEENPCTDHCNVTIENEETTTNRKIIDTNSNPKPENDVQCDSLNGHLKTINENIAENTVNDETTSNQNEIAHNNDELKSKEPDSNIDSPSTSVVDDQKTKTDVKTLDTDTNTNTKSENSYHSKSNGIQTIESVEKMPKHGEKVSEQSDTTKEEMV
ncbi:uncharacterized protein LOC116344372 isoform X2 [Contarinia nasturtii]|nr:uncharacterized protein LOC116344372 isoform X2 [Contarinia nasturtii]